MTEFFFNLSLPFVSISLLSFIYYTFSRKRAIFTAATVTSIISFVCLSMVILLMAYDLGFAIIHIEGAHYLIFAWTIMAIYFVAEFQCRIRLLGSILMPIALMLMLISMFEENKTFVVSGTYVSLATVLHIVFVFLGLGLIFLAFAAAILFRLKIKALKSHQKSGLDGRLPALPILKRLLQTSFYCGFPALTIGLILGIFYAGTVLKTGWIWDAKIIWGSISWLIYSLLFFFRQTERLSYEALAKGVIALFIIVIMSFLFTSHKPSLRRGNPDTTVEQSGEKQPQ